MRVRLAVDGKWNHARMRVFKGLIDLTPDPATGDFNMTGTITVTERQIRAFEPLLFPFWAALGLVLGSMMVAACGP